MSLNDFKLRLNKLELGILHGLKDVYSMVTDRISCFAKSDKEEVANCEKTR